MKNAFVNFVEIKEYSISLCAIGAGANAIKYKKKKKLLEEWINNTLLMMRTVNTHPGIYTNYEYNSKYVDSKVNF